MPRRKRRVEEPPVIEGPEFKCSFMEMHEFMSLNFSSTEDRRETRLARYHGSNFWKIKDFGTRRWVIAGYLRINWRVLMQEGHSVEDIFRCCVKHLNKPPERRKFQKRITKPLFGILQPEAVKIVPREKDGVEVLEVLAVTNKRKSNYVWGEGQTVPMKVDRRKSLL